MNKAKLVALFFRNSSSACLFGWQNAESLPCSFFCCVFYTRQIGNYVCFIVFFHGYFVRTVWLYTFALLFPFRVRLSTMPRLINCNFLLDCWLTFFTMISFNFFCTIIFHINYSTQHAAELERMESSSNQMHDFSIHNCPF